MPVYNASQWEEFCQHGYKSNIPMVRCRDDNYNKSALAHILDCIHDLQDSKPSEYETFIKVVYSTEVIVESINMSYLDIILSIISYKMSHNSEPTLLSSDTKNIINLIYDYSDHCDGVVLYEDVLVTAIRDGASVDNLINKLRTHKNTSSVYWIGSGQ